MDEDVKRKYIEAGRIGREALELARTLIEPGTKLLDVAEAMEKFVIEQGAKPAFPVNLSINNDAAHYTPASGDKKVFKTGDVVKVDFGAHIDGYMSDTAITLEVGESGKHSDLIDATREALDAAISLVRPMRSVNEIGGRIADVIGSFGFKPVRNLGGHGVERYDLHATLFIPNYDDGNVVRLQPDHAIAIEPFASTGIGMIHSGPPGNIYILDAPKVREDEVIYKNFRTLPFAERWLAGLVEDHKTYLKSMVSSREVSPFPILREHNNTLISQAEHTILVLNDEIIVTTRK
ncbi:methionyl aminopeptidase [Thermoplasma volcanium GSS1]|uniref:Methionine aminopeptidase n=1 Tax=Thermoplasma volcanium (strain ATCC 51530 / DSM 4299 / JCM 9571 / NBRC 15438 / GSS1) TaxID=273116 RepID=Q97CJ9_THEVO|nr:type II methionyl aminopeptidase [Thermoplasma volcanium]BAB59244.1 methionyl aminopeptidase [Thermoplasma volcanium GSS1]